MLFLRYRRADRSEFILDRNCFCFVCRFRIFRCFCFAALHADVLHRVERVLQQSRNRVGLLGTAYDDEVLTGTGKSHIQQVKVIYPQLQPFVQVTVSVDGSPHGG